MNSTPIASDLSYLVLQKQRRDAQLGLQSLDSTNQKLYAIAPCVFDGYAADRAAIRDSYQGESKLILSER